jgi:hypothetical protein
MRNEHKFKVQLKVMRPEDLYRFEERSTGVGDLLRLLESELF